MNFFMNGRKTKLRKMMIRKQYTTIRNPRSLEAIPDAVVTEECTPQYVWDKYANGRNIS